MIVGVIVGAYAFRTWLPPRYQATYSEQFPVLKLLLPSRADSNLVLPTPVIEATSSISMDELLGLSGGATETTPAAEVVVTEEATPSTPEPTPTQPPATPTPMPTAAPTLEPTPAAQLPPPTTDAETLASSAPVSLAPPEARNFGFQYVRQTWNNCGPANVTMALSYYGWQESQDFARQYLRGTNEDKNVSPQEIVNFVNEQSGVRALYRIGADLDTLQRLVAAGLPIMVELGYAPEGNDWLGHYQTVVGYNTPSQTIFVYDSYIPSDQGLPVAYRDFDRNWQQFSRTLIVLYPQEREGEVLNILGDLATAEGAYQVALETAQREARENPQNGFAWFNIGKAQTRLGNYEAAAAAFDRARTLNLPWRMSWYQFEPFEAYYETGRFDDVLALVQSNQTTLGGDYVEETLYWEGRVYEARGELAQAASSYRRALRSNSRYEAARTALERVS